MNISHFNPLTPGNNSEQKKKKKAKSSTTVAGRPSSTKPKTEKTPTHPLAYIFDKDRDKNVTIPYHQQGDPKMYTPENLKKRQQLKQNAGIVDSVRRFGALYSKDVNGEISKEEYVRVHSLIASVLHPGKPESEIQRIVEDDWVHDSQGSETLNDERFFAAIFELVDLWCKTTSASEYIMFIDTLLIRVKHPGAQDPNAYSILTGN